MQQEFDLYTTEDHLVWKTLFERQMGNLKNKAASDYLKGLRLLEPALNEESIPDFKQLNTLLSSKTGWIIEVVPGLIPVDQFFDLLSQRKFPSSTWLRRMDQLDYLEEPDMFHDVFGHVPLLAIPAYADAMQQFGECGLLAKDDPHQLQMLQRLYWYTIEFGLVMENKVIKVFGAGLASSFGETNSALELKDDNYLWFSPKKVMVTDFHTDHHQDFYFVLQSIDELFECFEKLRSFNFA